jgi:hypothetical protein
MVLLGRLRLFQRHVGAGEIRAGVIAVLVEEKIVKLARQVIVMRNVGTRPRHRVELIEPPIEQAQRLQRAAEPRLPLRRDILDGKAQKAVDVIALDGERAVHIALAHTHVGREHDPPRQGRVMQHHGALCPAPDPVVARRAVGKGDTQPPVTDKMGQKMIEGLVPHRIPPVSRRSRHRASRVPDRSHGSLLDSRGL